MKLYDFAPAPNPKRVRMFLAEKGISVPSVQVNVREREQFTEAFRMINPFCTIPVLELDDGSTICESVAICRYFEETHPAPALFGEGAAERAEVEMWNRRAELLGYLPAADAVRNSAPMFADRGTPGVPGGVPQIPDLVARGRAGLERLLHAVDGRLSGLEFLAGSRFSIAEITLYVAIWFAARADIAIPANCENVRRWYDAVASRPSAEA